METKYEFSNVKIVNKNKKLIKIKLKIEQRPYFIYFEFP